jgi:hypothetical protein
LAFSRDVEDRAHLRDAAAVGDVELGLSKRRRDLILHDFGTRARTDDVGADLDLFELADIDADRGVELQCTAARSGLGATEHHADLLTQLVDEDHHALRARDRRG